MPDMLRQRLQSSNPFGDPVGYLCEDKIYGNECLGAPFLWI